VGLPVSARQQRVTAHFVLGEFDCRDGSQVRGRDEGAIAHLAAWWLEPLRATFGPVTVHSGFRSVPYNRKVGGARYSVHLLRTPLPRRPNGSSVKAAAADVTCAAGNPALWAEWARQHRGRFPHLAHRGRGGIGFYPGFVHLDTGPARDWR
jgi:hypothetical protein